MSDQPTTRTVEGRLVPAEGTWMIDPTHTTIAAVARHLMVTKVRGHFASFSGTINVAENPKDSTVEITMDAASITTGTEDRDNHLRSADFLDVESYPTLTFRSTSVEAEGDKWRLTGDLTIRDITKSIALDLTFLGVANDPWGNAKAAFEATAQLERQEWDLTWNVPLNQGGVLVSDKFKIEIEAQATPQQ
ncbi:MAG: YceI family protein [Acidimicrobiia bacterium]|nr:YceI family protein [Acidimicrobiia bacterium]MDH3397852.1 YceI family protein [Acidimicrobiia bacterium]